MQVYVGAVVAFVALFVMVWLVPHFVFREP